MSLIDTKLDLHLAVRKYAEEAHEDEAFLIICLDADKSNLMLSVSGNNDDFSAVAANQNNWLKLDDSSKRAAHEKMKEVVLNMALNILASDEKSLKSFINAVDSAQQ